MAEFPELDAAMRSVAQVYRERGLFQGRIGFGVRPAVLVIDFSYGWTDDAYAYGGGKPFDTPVENTRSLLDAARRKSVPIVFTTLPLRPESGYFDFKAPAERYHEFRPIDRHACEIDARLAPQRDDLVIEKEGWSAFFGTGLASHLIGRGVDTVLIAGCSTSACVRATAMDAMSYRFRPAIVSDCVGDRAEAAHVWTLFDIQARFADVVRLEEALGYLGAIDEARGG